MTYAEAGLPVTRATFDEVRQKLSDAGCVAADAGWLSMHGIRLLPPDDAAPTGRTLCWPCAEESGETRTAFIPVDRPCENCGAAGVRGV